MKSLLLLGLMGLLSTAAVAVPHMETLYTIALPHAPATKPSANYVNTDSKVFYVSTEEGITAASLKSKSVLWSAPVSGSLYKLYEHGSRIVAFAYPFDVVALDSATGKQSWKNTMFDLDPKMDFLGRGDQIAMITPSKITILNATSGATLRTSSCHSLEIESKTNSGPFADASADPTVYCLINDKEFTAFKMFSGTQIWKSTLQTSSFYYVFGGQYILLTNMTIKKSGGVESDLIILDAATGHLTAEVKGLPQIEGPPIEPVPVLSGTTLTIITGALFTAREIKIDVTTGAILSNHKYNGPSNLVGGRTLKLDDIHVEVQLSTALKVNAVPTLGSGSSQNIISFVPSEGGPMNMEYYGQGTLQVGNLQGWTLWRVSNSTSTKATLLGRNEMTPHWEPSVAKDGDAYLYVVGDEIKAQKLVL